MKLGIRCWPDRFAFVVLDGTAVHPDLVEHGRVPCLLRPLQGQIAMLPIHLFRAWGLPTFVPLSKGGNHGSQSWQLSGPQGLKPVRFQLALRRP